MKKLFLVALAALLLLCGCGKTRVTSTVNTEEFYESLTYPALLEKVTSVKDSETVYLPDGTVSQNDWFVEKTESGYNLILNFDDGVQYFYNGEAYMDIADKDGLYYIVHFGWGYTDFQAPYLENDINAPESDYTILRKGSTVTATCVAGDMAEDYSLWGVTEADTLKFVYELDSKGKITRYQKLFGDTLMVERIFTYDVELEFPKEVTDTENMKRHSVFFTLHVSGDETGETHMIPDGYKIVCGTGYELFADYEYETPFDWENTPITDNTEISIAYPTLYE